MVPITLKVIILIPLAVSTNYDKLDLNSISGTFMLCQSEALEAGLHPLQTQWGECFLLFPVSGGLPLSYLMTHSFSQPAAEYLQISLSDLAVTSPSLIAPLSFIRTFVIVPSHPDSLGQPPYMAFYPSIYIVPFAMYGHIQVLSPDQEVASSNGHWSVYILMLQL